MIGFFFLDINKFIMIKCDDRIKRILFEIFKLLFVISYKLKCILLLRNLYY